MDNVKEVCNTLKTTCRISTGPNVHLSGELLNEWITIKVQSLYPKSKLCYFADVGSMAENIKKKRKPLNPKDSSNLLINSKTYRLEFYFFPLLHLWLATGVLP